MMTRILSAVETIMKLRSVGLGTTRTTLEADDMSKSRLCVWGGGGGGGGNVVAKVDQRRDRIEGHEQLE
jgi:hypothetical protein